MEDEQNMGDGMPEGEQMPTEGDDEEESSEEE